MGHHSTLSSSLCHKVSVQSCSKAGINKFVWVPITCLLKMNRTVRVIMWALHIHSIRTIVFVSKALIYYIEHSIELASSINIFSWQILQIVKDFIDTLQNKCFVMMYWTVLMRYWLIASSFYLCTFLTSCTLHSFVFSLTRRIGTIKSDIDKNETKHKVNNKDDIGM